VKRFRNELTENLYWGRVGKSVPSTVAVRAHNKIKFIYHAQRLNDIGIMPGARLEKLSGKRKGQYSLRVNDQWRICFVWHDNQAMQIEFVDYHK
jgi:toxin HigB-1